MRVVASLRSRGTAGDSARGAGWRLRGPLFIVGLMAAMVTTEELLLAAGVSREVIYKWVAQRLLARPTFTTSTSGLIAVWPREALAKVRFIAKKEREDLPLKELVNAMQARWPAPK